MFVVNKEGLRGQDTGKAQRLKFEESGGVGFRTMGQEVTIFFLRDQDY